MKRGLAFALAALALVAGNTAVQAADIDLSLNLRYTDPADPSEGGSWFLMGKTNTAGANTGIAGLSVYLTNINTAGIAFGNGTAIGTYPVVTQATLGANVATPGNTPFNSTAAGVTNIVYGQDLVTTIKTIGEGAGTPGIIATDPLRNAAWANSTLLISGTFGAARPAFNAATDGNVFNAGGAAVDATISTTVRGDSRLDKALESPAGAGLLFGDLNRNGTVSFLGDVQPAFLNVGVAGKNTWGDGDFNDSGSVSFLGDVQPAFNNIGVAAPPAPAIGAVPEPATLALLSIAGLGLMAAGRRK